MLGALSLIRMTIASSVEPRLCGLFPACKSADYSIRYGDAAVFGAQAVPFLVMRIEQEVTGPNGLFNDSLSSSHSLLHEIEYILTLLAKVWLRSDSHSPASYRSEESRPYLGIDIQLGNSHVYCMLNIFS